MRLTPIYSKKLGQWKLCHDALCAKGETRCVAIILTSDDPAKDEKWAKAICDGFNAAEALREHAAYTAAQRAPSMPAPDGRRYYNECPHCGSSTSLRFKSALPMTGKQWSAKLLVRKRRLFKWNTMKRLSRCASLV